MSSARDDGDDGNAMMSSDSPGRATEAPDGGETACWAHLVCSGCGALESEGHREGCPLAPPGRSAAGDDLPERSP